MIKRLIVKCLEFRSDKNSFLKHLPVNSRVLDIGCGDCRRLRYRSYFRRDLVHHGLDIHEDSRCNSYLESFHLVDIGKNKFPFEKDYFDLVVISHVIEHMPKNDFLFCIKEIRRVLKFGGYLYIEFPSEKTCNYVSAKTLKKFALPITTLNFFDDKTHMSLYAVQEIVETLEKESLVVYSSGEIREPVKKYLSPLLLLIAFVLRSEDIFTGALWSLVNWASFVTARKEISANSELLGNIKK